MLSPNNAIGGYFQLELQLEKKDKYPQALKFQSARAAFYALLQQMPNIRRVYLPSYICDSMLAPVHATGKYLEFYEINEGFHIQERVSLRNDDILVYVDYFGVCCANVQKILEEYPPEQVVIDCSQAFYSGPYDCLANIYSPRKFFGVPDGGLLITKRSMNVQLEDDQDSIHRMSHLLRRLAFSAEEGYANYRLAEASLTDPKPKAMSKLTLNLLQSINYCEIERRRKSNFNFLHNALKKSNLLSLDEVKNAAMCYPYLPEKKIDRSVLAKNRIFIPLYWPEVLERKGVSGFGVRAAQNLIAIPCDQRYGFADLTAILNGLGDEVLS